MAAALMLTTPAMVVVSRMDNSVELIWGLGEYATKLQIKAQTGDFSKRCGKLRERLSPQRAPDVRIIAADLKPTPLKVQVLTKKEVLFMRTSDDLSSNF